MPIHDWSRVDEGLFHDFHQGWAVRIKNALNVALWWDDLDALVERKRENDIDDVPYHDLANCIVVKRDVLQTVAAIEIVSPGNTVSKDARQLFVDRCVDFLAAGVHLLVVDLFPSVGDDSCDVHQAIWGKLDDVAGVAAFSLGKDRIVASFEAGPVKTSIVESFALGDELPNMPLNVGTGLQVIVPLAATYEETWREFPAPLQRIVEAGMM